MPGTGRTRGTETSKYPQEEKTTVIPEVVASEPGQAQTGAVYGSAGVVGPPSALVSNLNRMGRRAIERESRVRVNGTKVGGILSRWGPVKPPLNLAAPSAKAKYS